MPSCYDRYPGHSIKFSKASQGEAFEACPKIQFRQYICVFLPFFLTKSASFQAVVGIQSPYTVLANPPRIGTIGNHQIQGSFSGCSIFLPESDAFL